MEIAAPGAEVPRRGPEADDRAMRQAAEAFETAFLAEMLKAAGLGRTPEGFGGGAGEDQFASFLVREQARAMTEAGGIGLSEVIFEAMKERRDG